MLKVNQLMEREVFTVPKDRIIEKAIQKMHSQKTDYVLVVDEKAKCLIIFTDSDIKRIIVKKIPLANTIESVMTKEPITILSTGTFAEARHLFSAHRIRHLPVIDRKNVLSAC